MTVPSWQRSSEISGSRWRTFSELKKLVHDWGMSRGLGLPSIEAAMAQMSKVTEECLEVSDALKVMNEERTSESVIALKTEIGDLITTILMLTKSLGVSPEECLDRAYEKIKNRTGISVDGIFIKDEEAESRFRFRA
jgi:NTP pyrophosphatase (non-canonical NTP hydrolase)